MAGDKKLSEFDSMGYDNSTPVFIPAIKYSSSEAGATKENRNIPLELFYNEFLFSYRWTDYKVKDNPSWLRVDTFSWHSGNPQHTNSYSSVYQHLLNDTILAESVWIQKASIGYDGKYGLICYGDGKYINIIDSYLRTSIDGETWNTATNISSLVLSEDDYWVDLIRQGNKFYLFSLFGYVATSTDGETWTSPIQITELQNKYWGRFIYANGTFIAWGEDEGPEHNYITTSIDGENWETPTQLQNFYGYSIAFGKGKFISISAEDYKKYSTSIDGIIWSELEDLPVISDDDWINITFGNDKFMLISENTNPYMTTSEDGENWETPTLAGLTSSEISYLGFTNKKFFISNASDILYMYEPELKSETISGITISYYRADDGHKVCLADQEENLISLYNTVGIAWYYLLDTTNMRFKLPRTKFGFTGFRDEVGGYIEQQIKIPNHYHIISTMGNNAGNFVATNTADTIDRADTSNLGIGRRNWNGRGDSGGFASETTQFTGALITTVAKQAQSKNGYEYGAYGNSTLIQPRATQMYLYCFVGNFTQNSIMNIAGQNLSNFNEKADTDLNNVNNNIDFIIDSQEPTAENNYTWYNLYRSGRVEQGGISYASALGHQINLPVTMENGSYTLTLGNNDPSGDAGIVMCAYRSKSVDSFIVDCGYNGTFYPAYINWNVKGKADLT